LIRIFIRAIFSSLRRRARACGIPHGQCGAVAFVQRFGSSVNLHPHVHVLVLDGVFAGLEGEAPRFYPLRAPDEPDVAAVAETTSRRIQALLTKKGIGASSGEEDEDPLMRDTPWLAGLYAHGVRGRIATGPNAGKRVTTWERSREAQEPETSARRCANVDGFSVHARERLRTQARAKRERDSAKPQSTGRSHQSMSVCQHIGDRSSKISAAICCGLHWLSSVWSVFPAVAWRIG
jgi:hypothetical protein